MVPGESSCPGGSEYMWQRGVKKSLKTIKFYRMAPVLRPKAMFRKKKTRSE